MAWTGLQGWKYSVGLGISVGVRRVPFRRKRISCVALSSCCGLDHSHCKNKTHRSPKLSLLYLKRACMIETGTPQTALPSSNLISNAVGSNVNCPGVYTLCMPLMMGGELPQVRNPGVAFLSADTYFSDVLGSTVHCEFGDAAPIADRVGHDRFPKPVIRRRCIRKYKFWISTIGFVVCSLWN